MMKIHFLSLTVPLVFFSGSSFAQKYSFDNPVDYNNHIVARQDSVLEKSIYYSVQAINSDDENANNAMRLEVLRRIDQSLGELKNTATYKNDGKLRDEAIEVLTLYKEIFTTEYQEMNSLKKSSQDSFEAMEKYFSAQYRAENKLNHASKKFAKAQLDFASRYNLTVEEGPMHSILDLIFRINQYSRAMFLEQFKVSKINAAFLDALNAQKSGSLEGKRKELQNASTAAFNTINDMPAFNGEQNLKAATLQLIGYFKDHAEKEYVEMENIIKNPKPESKDIQRFNQMVLQMNEESTRLIEGFNKANRAFMRENMPFR